jgi:hypothetical protein
MRLVLLLLAALTLAAPHAWGCSYDIGGPLTLAIKDPVLRKRAEEQAKEIFQKAHYILRGRILKLFKDQEFKAIIQTRERFKGNPPNIFEITYHAGSSACGYEFRPNQEPLLVLFEKEGNFYSGGPAVAGIFAEGGAELTFLEKLSTEHKAPQNKSNKKPKFIEKSEFLTPMKPRNKDEKPISEQAYIQKVKSTLKNCKSSKSIEKIAQTDIRFSRRNYINLTYAEKVRLSVAGKDENILNIWIPYYSQFRDDITLKDQFLEPLLETADGKTLILEGCEFPDPSAFFEPAAPAQ